MGYAYAVGGIPQRPLYLVSMMDCARQAKVKPCCREMSTLGSGRTKGWACGVAEKGSDWLGSYTGPHTKEVWMGMRAQLCNKDKISHG